MNITSYIILTCKLPFFLTACGFFTEIRTEMDEFLMCISDTMNTPIESSINELAGPKRHSFDTYVCFFEHK